LFQILKRKKSETSAWDVFWMSALSRLGATLATYPLFFLKCRLQVYDNQSREGYANLADAVQKIHHEEGLSKFYNGMPAKCLQTVLAVMILTVVKETTTGSKKCFKKEKQ